MAADYLIDTNILLRHLLQDTGRSPAATAFLGRVEAGEFAAILTPLAVAEVVWVLSGRSYPLERHLIRDVLNSLIQTPNLTVLEFDLVVEALDLFADLNIDFIDGYHAAVARRRKMDVYSFDHDFDRVPGITRFEP